MGYDEIVQLLESKIPDYSKSSELHLLQFHVHAYKFIAGKRHPMVVMLCKALFNLDQCMQGYAETMIERIASFNKKNFEQVIQVFGEIHVLMRASIVSDNKFIVSEPRKKKTDKNPELRSVINGLFYAAEVKTPQLFRYSNQRQSGFQITSQLSVENFDFLKINEKIVTSRVLTVRDYLVSAEEKFKAYTENDEYKNDFRLLFIVWDDYINEPISALVGPYSGLFTENSFHNESNFSIIDGVFIVRHQHQFYRMLQYGELVNSYTDVFQFVKEQFPAAFIQNPYGRKVPESILLNFGAINPNDVFYLAEYQTTDFVDWRSGIALSGLNSISQEYHQRVFNLFKDLVSERIERYINDIALFSNINLSKIMENLEQGSDNDVLLEKLKKTIFSVIRVQQHQVEDREKKNWESYNKKREMLNGHLKDLYHQKRNLNWNILALVEGRIFMKIVVLSNYQIIIMSHIQIV